LSWLRPLPLVLTLHCDVSLCWLGCPSACCCGCPSCSGAVTQHRQHTPPQARMLAPCSQPASASMDYRRFERTSYSHRCGCSPANQHCPVRSLPLAAAFAPCRGSWSRACQSLVSMHWLRSSASSWRCHLTHCHLLIQVCPFLGYQGGRLPPAGPTAQSGKPTAWGLRQSQRRYGLHPYPRRKKKSQEAAAP
jgi:hypothetical protein